MKNNNDKKRHSYIFTRETLGMTVLLFSALMLLILITYNTVFSSLGAAICAFMYGTFGYGSYLVVAALAYLGVWLVFEKKIKISLRAVAVSAATLAVFFMLFHAVTTRDFTLDGYGAYLSQCYAAAEEGYAGYTFGGALSGLFVYPVARGTTFIGAYVIFSILFLLCAYLLFLVVRREIVALVGSGSPEKARTVQADEGQISEGRLQHPAEGREAVQFANQYADSGEGYGAGVYAAPQQYDAYSAPAQNVAAQNEGRDRIYAGAAGQFYAGQNSAVNEPSYRGQNEQPAPSLSDEDRFSPENLGRKILFENGEFAAESYRRNMIFNDDSYFNHPVHNSGDYLTSFSGKKPSSVQPVQSVSSAQSEAAAAEQNESRSSVPQYTQSYTDSYAEEVERSGHTPATPSYIYGDKPVQSLDYDDGALSDEPSYEDEPEQDQPSYDAGESYDTDDYDIADDGRDDDADEFIRESGRFEDVTPRTEDREQSDIISPRADDRSTLFGDISRGEARDGGVEFSADEDDFFAESPRDMPVGDSRRNTDDEFSSLRGALPAEEEDEPTVRRSQSQPAEQPRERTNDLRNIFSSDNSNISDAVRPDTSRLASRREDTRENLFDGDDDYLDDGEADLGTRGLRPDAQNTMGRRGGDISPVPSEESSSSISRREDALPPAAVPSRIQREEPRPAPAPVPEKPKHVWKKYVRPSLDLLVDYPENNNANIGEIEDNKRIIIDTLENSHIASHISDVVIGPAITRYDIIIEDKTNIKSAMRCREAIAMALMKENVTAYLNYSKGAISIEVPNSQRSIVGLKSMLTSNEFINSKPNTLTFALGKSVEGRPNCPDITKMPHLLVAGTTGSGKSICLSSLIISLLYKYGPDELRFILVDPKQSEFISYESLPHLIINEIISDVDKAIKALNWAIKEMERRYALFKEMTLGGTLVKNLNEYNSHLPEGEEKLPKIVIILDEFGDLMLQRKKDIESRIIRLVQKSRACGIHLILATQRPSVDCITGLIKSNLPTRIGFKVNSFDDSRTIFDIGGAEKLLGAGDMYFRSASNPDLARIQGCFIDSPEVQAVTDFVKKNNESYFDQSVSDFINTVEEVDDDGESAGGDSDGEGDVKIDDKFIQALKFCVSSNQASVSMLQRRFPIGYVKACKIIDWMENMNYITQSEGSKPRKVLLSMDEFTRIYGEVDD